MRALALIPLLIATASPARTPAPPPEPPVRHSGIYRGDLAEILPPTRFQSDAGFIAIFSDAAVAELCPKKAIACVRATKDGTPVMVMPNPCRRPAIEYFGTVACHELGHVNGWRHGG